MSIAPALALLGSKGLEIVLDDFEAAPHIAYITSTPVMATCFTDVWTITGDRSSSAAARTRLHGQVIDDVEGGNAVALRKGLLENRFCAHDRHWSTSLRVAQRGNGRVPTNP